MDFPKTRLEYIFGRYYDKTATSAELEELAELLQLSDDDMLSEVMQQKWEEQQSGEQVFSNQQRNQMLDYILTHKRNEKEPVNVVKMYNGRLKYIAAAAVVIVVGISVFLFKSNQNDQPANITTNARVIDAMPGGNRATLTLADGKTIELDLAKNGILLNDGNIEVSKAVDGEVSYQVKSEVVYSASQYNVLATPKGGQYHLVLPDGSEVWLNAASSLKFPNSFAKNRREVELKGEAYFEIEKDPAKPFIVKSKLGDIQVLGTHFNVMAYDDEATMKTTLLEGSVKISSKHTSSMLVPGQQADLAENGSIKIINGVDLEKEMAWKNGLFYFNDSDIELVMRQASRWYNINVSYEGSIPTKRLTGKIPRNVKASELLNMLKYSGINFRVNNDRVIVTNK